MINLLDIKNLCSLFNFFILAFSSIFTHCCLLSLFLICLLPYDFSVCAVCVFDFV